LVFWQSVRRQVSAICSATASRADDSLADDILGKPLEEARLAAVSGDRSGLDRFWYDLRLELMSENRAWESTLTATQQQILDGLVPNVADR
jgi:hypothetical protein